MIGQFGKRNAHDALILLLCIPRGCAMRRVCRTDREHLKLSAGQEIDRGGFEVARFDAIDQGKDRHGEAQVKF